MFQASQDDGTQAEALTAINQLTRASRWKIEQFKEAFKQATLKTFLVEHKTQIIGFAVFSVVAPEAHLVNVAIAPQHQRAGIGLSLLQFAFTTLAKIQIAECWLEVRVSNLQAQSLYKKIGFAEVQKRLGFYEEPKEDALLMMKTL